MSGVPEAVEAFICRATASGVPRITRELMGQGKDGRGNADAFRRQHFFEVVADVSEMQTKRDTCCRFISKKVSNDCCKPLRKYSGFLIGMRS